MTLFESIKAQNIDELVDWIDKYCTFDNALHWKWWDENYCNKCESITTGTNVFGYPQKYAYCELNHNCRYFKDMKNTPDNKQIIKMWLESEIKKY